MGEATNKHMGGRKNILPLIPASCFGVYGCIRIHGSNKWTPTRYQKNKWSLAYIDFSTNHNGYRALLRTHPSAKHDGISNSCFFYVIIHYSKLLASWNKREFAMLQPT